MLSIELFWSYKLIKIFCLDEEIRKIDTIENSIYSSESVIKMFSIANKGLSRIYPDDPDSIKYNNLFSQLYSDIELYEEIVSETNNQNDSEKDSLEMQKFKLYVFQDILIKYNNLYHFVMNNIACLIGRKIKEEKKKKKCKVRARKRSTKKSIGTCRFDSYLNIKWLN